MPIQLRVTLIIASLVTCYFTLRKIRKSQMQIEDSLFWIFTSISLVILSVFPKIAFFFSDILAIDSAVNFVYLVVIFLLILKVFMLSVKLSQTEERIKSLVQRIAIDTKQNEKNIKKMEYTQEMFSEAATAVEEMQEL